MPAYDCSVFLKNRPLTHPRLYSRTKTGWRETIYLGRGYPVSHCVRQGVGALTGHKAGQRMSTRPVEWLMTQQRETSDDVRLGTHAIMYRHANIYFSFIIFYLYCK